MVAICTGPAFATDDAGNLILAGERRKASPSPCALKDANGLYTDPNGGLWVPDQVSFNQYNIGTATPGSRVNAPAIVPYSAFTQTLTNGTCWPMLVFVECSYGIWIGMDANSYMWWELGAGINTTAIGWVVVGSQNTASYFDWFTSHTQIVARIRLEPHTSQSVTVQSRINGRSGSAVMNNATYRCNAIGYAVS